MAERARREIRAVYDSAGIVVYQAFRREIALPALEAHRFVPPFSLTRITWIKPSFLWMMHRNKWGQKPGQEYILAARITRAGWEEVLSHAVLTAPEKGVYHDDADWRRQLDRALVHVQWDPERSIRDAALPCDRIQVGLSRHIVARYVEEWTLQIRDYTPLVRKIRGLLQSGESVKAAKLLPSERVYPVSLWLARRLGMSTPRCESPKMTCRMFRCPKPAEACGPRNTPSDHCTVTLFAGAQQLHRGVEHLLGHNGLEAGVGEAGIHLPQGVVAHEVEARAAAQIGVHHT
jgi:hypothetical protein